MGYVHRRLSNTMSTCTIWACARLNTRIQRDVTWPKLLSFDALVSRFHYGWRLRYGKLTLHWTLNR